MSNVTHPHNPWQLAADAADRIAELLDDIPGWAYEYAEETRDELLQTAALLQQAIPLLERARGREVKRCSEDALP
jgi:hypothetical protein